jgi:Flp pilus assembly protein TadD
MNYAAQSAALLLALGCAMLPALGAQSRPPSKAAPPAKTAPRDPAQDLLAQAYEALENKNFPSAAARFEEYLSLRPDDALSHFQLGYAYSEMREYAKARKAYGRAIGLNPKLAEPHLNLGLILLSENSPAAAAESLARAAALRPEDGRIRFLLATALERAGQPADAVEHYQSAAERMPAEFDVRFGFGRTLLALNRAAEAEREFRAALAAMGDSAPARLGLAESLIALGKFEPAAEELAAYLRQAPEDSESRVQLASVLVDLKRFEEAGRELDALEQSGQASVRALLLRSQAEAGMKRPEAAIAALEKAAALDARNAEIHARLGKLWLEMRNFPKAVASLNAALKLQPERTDSLRDMVAALYLAEDYAGALKALERLGQRIEPDARFWFVKATCYDKLGGKKEALAAYKKFLELDRGASPDQDFQARARVRILTRELERRR